MKASNDYFHFYTIDLSQSSIIFDRNESEVQVFIDCTVVLQHIDGHR